MFNASDKIEITSQEQLEGLILKELDEITNDSRLKKTFDNIKKLLDKNARAREFKKYLCNNERLLPHLSNIGLFKERVWKSYFKSKESQYDELLEEYRKVKARRKKIEEEAHKERTNWEKAIALFNQRFIVPFTLEVKNKEAVMLGNNDILELGYKFHDGSDETHIERDTLLKTLSQGEKKALYILNVIFEIEVRRQSGQETLFVIDDIADSFDYKNKYAIIQYLQEISEYQAFKQIILTHNFDFFRTVNSRFVKYQNCLMATRSSKGVELKLASGIKNPFLKDWKKKFYEDGKKRIASISFARNLIEYTKGESDQDYEKLTSILHWGNNSKNITQGDLDKIYSTLFDEEGSFIGNHNEPVINMIRHEAENCLNINGGINLEHKIVLSIAIRLQAEQFMASKIADPEFIKTIKKNRTQELLKKFRSKFHNEEAIKTLRNVTLMTPENIHLNAFMYEPIIDMSDESLKSLYQEVCNLSLQSS